MRALSCECVKEAVAKRSERKTRIEGRLHGLSVVRGLIVSLLDHVESWGLFADH